MLKTKEKKFLKDEAARLILGDESCREYLFHIIASSLDLDLDYVRNNLKSIDTHVSNHLDLVHQNTDLLYEPENEVINIKINYNYYKNSIIKNTCYIANLILRQTNKGKNYKPFKQIFQINLDNYDLFKQGEFIYKSSIIENKYHIKRDEMFTIIDIKKEQIEIAKKLLNMGMNIGKIKEATKLT